MGKLTNENFESVSPGAAPSSLLASCVPLESNRRMNVSKLELFRESMSTAKPVAKELLSRFNLIMSTSFASLMVNPRESPTIAWLLADSCASGSSHRCRRC